MARHPPTLGGARLLAFRAQVTRAVAASQWALMTLTLTGVMQGAAAQVLLKDDRGVDVRLLATPTRIVSLLPSLSETVCAIGACDRLVGTDRFSDWPDSVAALPKLGGIDDAQIERIVALRPDVVLVSPSSRVIDRLEALGLKVVVLQSDTFEDFRRGLTILSQMLDRPQQAAAVWTEIERRLKAAAERVPAALRGRRVYFEIDTTPHAAGERSYIGQMLARLGLRNAVPAELGPFPKLNPEYVVRAQPDIVMAAMPNLADMALRPGWSSLHALQQKQTCGFAPAPYLLLTRPGPRIGEAASLLADCLVALPPVR